MLSAAMLLLVACSHPLEPRGNGNILSASGTRDCFLEDFQDGADSCSKNLVVGAYRETYYAVPREGWKFDRWENYCTDGKSQEQCSFNIPADQVKNSWGKTVPPLVAVFSQKSLPPVFDGVDRDGNDSFASALVVADQGVTEARVGSTRDADYFAFTASATANYSVALEFSRPDIYLYWYNDDTNKTLLGESRGAGTTRQQIVSKRLEQGKTYFLGVQAVAQSGTQDYRLTISQDPAPPFADGTALYSYSVDANGELHNPVRLQGAKLQRRTVYFSFYGDYRQISGWCCKVAGGSESHAPRIDDASPPFVLEVDLTQLPNDGGLQRELYADLFLPDGAYLSDNFAYWTLEARPELPKFSISGEIMVGGNIVTDQDVNDPTAPFFSNNTTFTAQPLPNPVIANGFVSAVGTGKQGDRFADFPDDVDIYQVNVIGGQTLTLQVADYRSAEPSLNDIDLYVFNAQQHLVAVSDREQEFESILLDTSGLYYIVVEARNGISKYVLNIGDDFTSGRAANRTSSTDFSAKQLLVRYDDRALMASADGVATRDLLSTRVPDSAGHTRQGVQLLTLSGGTQSKALIASLDSSSQRFIAQSNVAAVAKAADSELLQDEKYLLLKLAKRLRARSDVRYAEPNYLLQATAVADDTHYQLQWHYPFMELPAAWDISTGNSASAAPLVAVVDTGVLLGHPDLAGQLVPGYDFIRDPKIAADGDGIDPNPDDVGDKEGPSQRSGFHGTHVAGTIAARSNNGMGVSGIAWGARIMPIRVLGVGGGSGYDLTQGILFAAGLPNDSGQLPERRADIINLSLGCSACYSFSLDEAIGAAREAGVIVVAAAGNNSNSTAFYPAAYNGVVAVSSVNSGSELASYSNFGSYVDVAAPGGDTSDRDADGYSDRIFSTLGDDSSGSIIFRYGWSIGTSMATPHVAGVAALMKAVQPDLTPQQFDLLLSSGVAVSDLGVPGRDDQFGYGTINALKAVQAAQTLRGGGQPGFVTANPTVLDFPHGLSSKLLSVQAQGIRAPTVLGVSVDQNWISVTPAQNVDGNGMGDYFVVVDRDALAAAVHRGEIRFDLSDGNMFMVPVYLQVLNQQVGAGDAGLLEVQLQDASTLAVVNTADVVPGNDGRYLYRFDRSVPSGDYRVHAGSDIDNNSVICGTGETCGAWPIQDSPETIRIDRDLSGVDFKLSTGTDFGVAK